MCRSISTWTLAYSRCCGPDTTVLTVFRKRRNTSWMNRILTILQFVGLSDVIGSYSAPVLCSRPAEPVFCAQRDRVAEAGSLAQVWNPAVPFAPCSFRSCALYAHSRTRSTRRPDVPTPLPTTHPPQRLSPRCLCLLTPSSFMFPDQGRDDIFYLFHFDS